MAEHGCSYQRTVQSVARMLARIDPKPWNQVQAPFRYYPQEKTAGVFCLETRALEAVIALGLYFFESDCQHFDDSKWSKIDRIPSAEKFSVCLNTLLSDIATKCPDLRDEIIVNQVETLSSRSTRTAFSSA